MKAEPIDKLLDMLPENDLTANVLKSLDFIIPGEYQSECGFDSLITELTGIGDKQAIEAIHAKAMALYQQSDLSFQKAVLVFQTVDQAAAFPETSVLIKNPKIINSDNVWETHYARNFALRFGAECVAYCALQSRSTDIAFFMEALANHYGGSDLMRITAMLSLDALLPLGSDCLQIIDQSLGTLNADSLTANVLYQAIKPYLPGDSVDQHKAFLGHNFFIAKSWLAFFMEDKEITQYILSENLANISDIIIEDFLNLGKPSIMQLKTFSRCGIESVAGALISRSNV